MEIVSPALTSPGRVNSKEGERASSLSISFAFKTLFPGISAQMVFFLSLALTDGISQSISRPRETKSNFKRVPLGSVAAVV